MERGYIHAVVIVVLTTLLGLLLLHFVPSMQVGSWRSRNVDMLSDVLDSAAANPDDALVQHARVDTCRDGLECINDMSGGEGQGMDPFYDAIDSIKSLGRPVRIAVLGDSYIEGDIFTAHLRERLQRHWGGCGVGFVPITDAIAGFRTTVTHRYGGWTEHHANEQSSGYNSTYANISGHYFNGSAGAWLALGGVAKDIARLDTCQESSLYFAGTGSAEAMACVNNGEEQAFTLNGNGGVGKVTVKGRIGAVRWRITRNSGLVFLGASLDPDQGIVVDNFSLRSSGGNQLKMVAPKMFTDFDQARHYDLIIIMYGLNVAGREESKYEAYQKMLGEVITTMKRAMPDTGFLLVGTSDREERYNGGFRTLPGVVSLINAQQQIAYDNKIAFWNLYTAMGGQGSIVEMVKNHQANLDYTHINKQGGKHLSAFLYDALEWGSRKM